MEPAFGWTLLSPDAIRRAEARLREEIQGVRDEIGFLFLHQAYADRFFPGTDLVIMPMWSDPAEPEKHMQWADELWSAMQPFSSGGVYVNYLGNEGEERVKAAYGTNYERLVALKNRYDPMNLFRFNQNIKPTV
jgi:FAD/FMN-containing dehydrogenase